jgi:hypothetical protein
MHNDSDSLLMQLDTQLNMSHAETRPRRVRTIPERYRSENSAINGSTSHNNVSRDFKFPSKECIQTDAHQYAEALKGCTIFEQCGFCGCDEARNNVVPLDKIDSSVYSVYKTLRQKLIQTTPSYFAKVVENDTWIIIWVYSLCKALSKATKKKQFNGVTYSRFNI